MEAATEVRKDLPIVLVAAAALIDADNRVLICKRPEGKSLAGLWEFPGGKVEPGESPEAALVRELREELSIKACETCLCPFTFASHTYEKFHLLMPLFLLRKWEGEIVSTVHPEIEWVRPNRLSRYPMPPADLPMIPQLRDLLS
ncbi:MAG: (deoxy)nucleoside triphosphate pyrophosphohydrolase [Alphaproteobacteria bacterium]|nr:(deoxy)nucleoside triphosphate pyrophosphohydrolase [Alphaproteobacteria bacterium]